MDITLQHSDGCPNWSEVVSHPETLQSGGIEMMITCLLIDTSQAAIEER